MRGGSVGELSLKGLKYLQDLRVLTFFAWTLSGGWFFSKNILIYSITYFHGAVQWLDYIEQKPR